MFLIGMAMAQMAGKSTVTQHTADPPSRHLATSAIQTVRNQAGRPISARSVNRSI